MKKLYIVKKSKIHNNGVFAACNIKKGAIILEYKGEKITKAEGDRRGDTQFETGGKKNGHVYIFSLNKRYDIDGRVPSNDAQWINHSCETNCDSFIDKGKIWIEAMKDIKKGEELSYNYGYGYADYTGHPCKCASKKCVGFIVGKRHMWRLRKKKQ